ncbi:MAG: biotin--protein ligase [Desulfurococcaceae archaeon]
MRVSCGEKKREGGKLVKACVQVEGGEVVGILLTGDFFVEPEEAVDRLVGELSALRAPLEMAPEAVLEAVRRSGARLIGVGDEEIREAVRRAISSEAPGRVA